MQKTESGRFCSKCQHTVIDSTGFTDAQLYDFFASQDNRRICGRMNTNQLNRIISIPPQPHSRLYRLAIAMGLTILALVPMRDAQAKFQPPFTVESIMQGEEKTGDADSTIIRGVVYDEKKEPIIGAIIQLFQNHQNIGGASSDIDGNFSIRLDNRFEWEEIEMKASYTSYSTEIIKIRRNDIKRSYDIELKINLDSVEGYIIYDYKVPLTDPYNPNTNIITSEQIEKMAR